MRTVVIGDTGDDRIFYSKNSKWYVDISKSEMINFTKSGGCGDIVAVDPDGGPYITVGNDLSEYHPTLPDIEISKIKELEHGIYQLTE
jgi:hypothetical protein